MRSLIPRPVPLASVVLLVTLLVACGRDPQLRVAEARNRFSARVNGFVVRDLSADAAQPARQVVDLDVLVRREGRESLPGVTLDVSVAGPDGKEKGHRLAWVDTSRLEKGNEVGLNVRLEGVAFQAGDGFFVEVRHPVPAAERGGYREFGRSS